MVVWVDEKYETNIFLETINNTPTIKSPNISGLPSLLVA